MMRAFLPLFLLAASPAWARETIDQFGRWGAFRDGRHCYAIAEPANGRNGASLALSSSPAHGVRIQFHARLSRPVDPRRAPVVRVGGRALPLVARDRDAWASDERGDLRILAAIRAADALSVVATDARGRRFADRYPLAGATSAIDAAAIACLTP